MLGGRLATRFGARNTLIASYLLGALGTTATALTMAPDGSYVALLPGLIVLSLCQGVIFTTMFSASATGVHPYEQGISSGIVSTGQQVGSAVGLGILVAIANAGTDGLTGEALRSATSDGLRTAVLVATGGIVALVLVALGFERAPSRTTAAAENAAAKSLA